jgi:PAS domain S-box-containing protein
MALTVSKPATSAICRPAHSSSGSSWPTHRGVTVRGDHVFGVLFDHCSEAVFTVDLDRRVVTSANARLEDLVGRSRESLVGAPVGGLFAAEAAAAGVLDCAGLHDEVAMCRVDGYPVLVEMTVAHLDHGEAPIAACIARDTTERRLLERELIAKHMALHTAHAELERAVDDLTRQNRELEERHRELARLSAQLSRVTRRVIIGELSAGIAHSLNNPLAALASSHKQMLQVITEHGGADLVRRLERFTQRSRDALARMEQTIQAVRRAHRSGSASSATRSIDLADEVATALVLFEGRLGGIEVRTIYGPVPRVAAPPGDLQHVLWNLIDNAIHAMPAGGALTLTTAAGDRADQVTLTVADSGPGIPASVRDQLFEPFVTARADGSGLGLSTARRLARDWGGDVRLVPGGAGATFEVSFPLRKEQPCPVTESSSSTTT